MVHVREALNLSSPELLGAVITLDQVMLSLSESLLMEVSDAND